jgi:uncharacterized protein (TIGR02001 family)
VTAHAPVRSPTIQRPADRRGPDHDAIRRDRLIVESPRPALAAAAIGLFLGLGLASPARAQLAVSGTLASDLRIRGLSFSDRRPVVSLALTYDHSSGFYAGATAYAGPTEHSGVQWIGYQIDVGYAGRIGSTGPGWDAGVANTELTQYLDHKYTANYTEIFGGVSGRNVSAHLFVSPDYLGEHVVTAYLDLEGAIHPAPRWRLFGHAGVLAPLGRCDPELVRTRFDLRAGVAREFDHVELQAAWTHISPRTDYPLYYDQVSDAFVASVSVFF